MGMRDVLPKKVVMMWVIIFDGVSMHYADRHSQVDGSTSGRQPSEHGPQCGDPDRLARRQRNVVLGRAGRQRCAPRFDLPPLSGRQAATGRGRRPRLDVRPRPRLLAGGRDHHRRRACSSDSSGCGARSVLSSDGCVRLRRGGRRDRHRRRGADRRRPGRLRVLDRAAGRAAPRRRACRRTGPARSPRSRSPRWRARWSCAGSSAAARRLRPPRPSSMRLLPGDA